MKKLNTVTIAVASSLALLAGCASNTDTQSTANSVYSDKLEQEIRSLKDQRDAQAREAAALRSEIDSLKTSSNTTHYSNVTLGADGDLLPPNAKPGECYSRVLIPATYETTTEEVLVKAASERVEVIPATYEWLEQEVLVQEESAKLEIIPATYKTVSEEMLVEPEKEVLKEIPAIYETVTEQILVKPAYTTWKKGRGPVEKINESTGEIMCLVEIPAEYRTVTKRVVATPARTEKMLIPAQYKTITRTVVDQPARTQEVVIPAQYKTVKVRQLVSETKEQRIPIPAEYGQVTKRKLVTDSSLEWREILCETNTTAGLIARIQRNLKEEGYDPGSIDGVLGAQTMQAIKAFQNDKGLPSGQLTMRTLESLGVEI